MANFVFGDVQEIVVSHLGNTYRYYPKSAESFEVDPGGFRSNDDANQVTSDGRMMRQINRVRSMIGGPIAADTISGAEFASLSLMHGSPVEGTWQFALISGAIYKGNGSPVGDLKYDTNAGTIDFKFSGGRELEQI